MCLSKETIAYFLNFPQLQKDWLLIYGIYTQNTFENKELTIDRITQMEYWQLVNLLLQRRNQSKQASLLASLQKVSVNLKCPKASISVLNSTVKMSISAESINYELITQQQKDPYPCWKITKSIIKAYSIKTTFDKLNPNFPHKPHHHANNTLKHYELLSCQDITFSSNALFIK